MVLQATLQSYEARMTKIRQLRAAARLHLSSNSASSGIALFFIKLIATMEDDELRDLCRIISLGSEEDMTNV